MAEGWTADTFPLDTERMLRVVVEHSARFVIVGGIATIIHGWSGSTFDVDIVPAPSSVNLNRLGRALRDLGARVWADPGRSDLLAGGKPPEADDFGFTAEGLRRARVWHLMTDAGALDLAYETDGVGGYEELIAHAERRTVFGLDLDIASLSDIIASKRAVARPKDLRVLPELEALQQKG